MSFRRFRASLLLAAGLLFATSAPALGDQPTAVATLQPGLWEITAEGQPPRKLCLADAGPLIQVRHGAAPCMRVLIAQDRFGATVHYSCPGAGWGRTTLRVDSPRRARIDTQGIADGAPFAYRAAGRRLGDCTRLAKR